MNNQHVIPVVDVFGSDVRRGLVDYALNNPKATEWRTKGSIADDIGASNESIRQNLPPLIQYGIFDVRDPDVKLPHHRRADTDVVTALVSWHETGGFPLTELFGTTGRQNLVEFFLDHADREESYSMSRISREGSLDNESISRNIETLVDSGLVTEVEGSWGVEYQLDTESDMAEFSSTLNRLLIETYKERSD